MGPKRNPQRRADEKSRAIAAIGRYGFNDVMAESQASAAVLALVRDLIFASRIAATARAVGAEVTIVREPAQLSQHRGVLLLVDLNQAGTVAAAAEWKRLTGGKVIGFVSHVDTTTIDDARRGGIDRILARSGFVEQLPQILANPSSAA